MSNYRPPISRDQYHELEAYYFRLCLFTTSVEFKDLKSEKQNRIKHEIAYMNMVLDILNRVFSVKHGTERAVVAWKKDTDEDEHKLIMSFSCIKTASLVLECNKSKITSVCKGLRPHTGGYIFKYKEDYEQNRNFVFDSNNDKFEFK